MKGATSTRSTSTTAGRRLVAIGLTLLLTPLFTTTAFADPAALELCGDGYWLKAEWREGETLDDEESWEIGPAWDDPSDSDDDENPAPPAAPGLTFGPDHDDGLPLTVGWSSTTSVEGVHVKSHGGFYGTSDPSSGTAGTAYGDDMGEYGINHIVFCYGEPQAEPEIDISPIFECWQEDPETEGYIAYFGWENRSTLDGDPYTVSREEAGFAVTPDSYESYFPDEFDYPYEVDGRPGRTDFYPNAAITIPDWDGSNIVFRLDGRTATASLNGPQCPAQPEPEIDLSPIFECWHEDGTGSYTAYFGWENRSTLGDDPYTDPISREDAGFGVTPASYESFFPTEFDYPTDGPRDGRTPFFPDAAITIPDWDGSNIVFRLDGRTATAGLGGPQCDIPEIGLVKIFFPDDQPTSEDEMLALYENWGDGWDRNTDIGGDFTLPDDFDMGVIYGATTYTVWEEPMADWQAFTCPDVFESYPPNGLGEFSYEDLGAWGPRHVVCNAPAEEPPMSRLTVTKDAVNYGGSDTFPFAGTCTYEGDEAATPISFALADNGTWTTGWVAAGAVCELHETNNRGASSVTYRLDGAASTLQPDGDVRVEMFQARDYALLVTNTFTSTPPPPPPPPPTVTVQPDIELVKEADVPADADGIRQLEYDPAAETMPTITYTYTVTNTGETTLSNVTVVDTPLGPVTLDDTTLSVDESTTGTLSHTLTTEDVTAGEVVNSATATGTAPNGTSVTDTDDESVILIAVLPDVIEREPAITLDKVALVDADENGDKVVNWRADEDLPTITYRYTITNTGETPLSGLTLVDDHLGTIALPADGLAVGAELVVTFDHEMLESEAMAGTIVNTATVTATSPDDVEVTASDRETVLVAVVLPIVIEPDETLPATGAALSGLALAGVLALLLGTGVIAHDRRRR